jgi:FKBP-type peptidyl-prolyl cis-trans isomerase
MNKTVIFTAAFLLTLCTFVRAEEKPAEPKKDEKKDEKPATAFELKTPKDKLSYALGADIGTQLHGTGMRTEDLDMEMVKKAMAATLDGSKAQLERQEIQKTVMDFITEKKSAEGKKFFEENKKKEGVNETASGLQYKIIKEGTGANPKPTDKVKVHYRGTLLDGTEFDSSIKRGEPATFGLNQVIPGWTEGLQLLKEGGKAELYIPSKLGYGPGGSGRIPPDATLVFEVELISIEK